LLNKPEGGGVGDLGFSFEVSGAEAPRANK
jgi:hypothetical protein